MNDIFDPRKPAERLRVQTFAKSLFQVVLRCAIRAHVPAPMLAGVLEGLSLYLQKNPDRELCDFVSAQHDFEKFIN